MKTIIAGGRDFDDYSLLYNKCNSILSNQTEVEIVSGGQRTKVGPDDYIGADYFGELYAAKKGYKLTVFPADWDKHGKAAGPIRNKKMAEYADGLIAFWDGKSRGTKSMISLAEEYGLKVRVIRYDKVVFDRFYYGEAWMWCHDCMSKLYSFDGKEDQSKSCPTAKKCRDQRDLYR